MKGLQPQTQAHIPTSSTPVIVSATSRARRFGILSRSSLHRSSGEANAFIVTDGIVHIDAGNEYIPDGWSGWDLSKRADIKTKAEDD